MPLPIGVSHLSPTVPVHVFEADSPGPTVVIQAGIHGDEVAGVHALSELLEEGYRPHHGRLLIIPVMNAAAYRARQRTAPGGLDMNRCFPGDADDPARERRLARAFMDLMLDEAPAMVATLHESWKRFHPEIDVSFGQTVIYGDKPMPEIVPWVVERMNLDLEHPYEKWAPHYYPVETASSEVIAAQTGCIGLCIETWMGFEEARRVVMQRNVVEHLLQFTGVRDRAE
jgi:hypothetical protein